MSDPKKMLELSKNDIKIGSNVDDQNLNNALHYHYAS